MEKNINMFEKYFARLFNSKSYLKHRIRRLIDKFKFTVLIWDPDYPIQMDIKIYLIIGRKVFFKWTLMD